MRTEQSSERRFREELANIVSLRRWTADDQSRQEMFEALSGLERRALVAGASDQTLRDIAETRFLAGILRNAVRPPRALGLRAVLRARERARTAQRRMHRRPVGSV